MTDDLNSALLEFGIWPGNSQKRTELAQQLAADGCTPADVELLGRYTEEATGYDLAKSPGRLATYLKPGAWADALRSARSAQDRRAAAQGPGGQLNAMRPEARSQEAEEARLAGMAYAMLHYDRWPPREVAKHLEVELYKLPGLVRCGAKIYGAADPDEATRRLLEPKGDS